MTLPEIERRNGKSSKYRKKVYEMDFSCRAVGSRIGPNRSTSGFSCSKMTSPGGPRKVISVWEKIVIPWFRSFWGRRSSPEKSYGAGFYDTWAISKFVNFFAHSWKLRKRYYAWSRCEKGRPGCGAQVPGLHFSLGETKGRRFRAEFWFSRFC